MEIQLNITPLENWGIALGKPVLIAGPCSAESEEQVMETCLRLKAQGNVHILRAGIWKPRTRPNSFEGIGSIGLQWIKEAGRATGLPVMVEVANVKHVYECLRTGIDILWIGARTTVNPFSVQEIADSLQGVDIPVIIKNPINPDLALWIGAFERFNKAGITKLAALHRGFSSHEKTKYRNRPQWEIPIELMRRLPELPVFCDPSHICGNRELLQSVAQKAMDLNFDGLMLESHINPSKALSDPEQQVVPERYGEIIRSLLIRQENSNNPVFIHSLEDLRDSIDGLDHEIVDLVARRMAISRKIGDYKKDNNITILQSNRWDEIIRNRTREGLEKGLSEEFMLQLLNALHTESIRHQTSVMQNKDN